MPGKGGGGGRSSGAFPRPSRRTAGDTGRYGSCRPARRSPPPPGLPSAVWAERAVPSAKMAAAGSAPGGAAGAARPAPPRPRQRPRAAVTRNVRDGRGGGDRVGAGPGGGSRPRPGRSGGVGPGQGCGGEAEEGGPGRPGGDLKARGRRRSGRGQAEALGEGGRARAGVCGGGAGGRCPRSSANGGGQPRWGVLCRASRRGGSGDTGRGLAWAGASRPPARAARGRPAPGAGLARGSSPGAGGASLALPGGVVLFWGPARTIPFKKGQSRYRGGDRI